jgi:hypothetical protein
MASKIRMVFEIWKAVHGHPKARLDQKRRSRIKTALTAGFGVQELEQAIRGALKDDFLMGRSPRSEGVVYDGLQTLLRDSAQIERLIDLEQGKRTSRRKAMRGVSLQRDEGIDPMTFWKGSNP